METMSVRSFVQAAATSGLRFDNDVLRMVMSGYPRVVPQWADAAAVLVMASGHGLVPDPAMHGRYAVTLRDPNVSPLAPGVVSSVSMQVSAYPSREVLVRLAQLLMDLDAELARTGTAVVPTLQVGAGRYGGHQLTGWSLAQASPAAGQSLGPGLNVLAFEASRTSTFGSVTPTCAGDVELLASLLAVEPMAELSASRGLSGFLVDVSADTFELLDVVRAESRLASRDRPASPVRVPPPAGDAPPGAARRLP